MIALACPHCGHGLRIADQYRGKAGRCRHCGGDIQVPFESTAPQPDAAALQTVTVRTPHDAVHAAAETPAGKASVSRDPAPLPHALRRPIARKGMRGVLLQHIRPGDASAACVGIFGLLLCIQPPLRLAALGLGLFGTTCALYRAVRIWRAGEGGFGVASAAFCVSAGAALVSLALLAGTTPEGGVFQPVASAGEESAAVRATNPPAPPEGHAETGSLQPAQEDPVVFVLGKRYHMAACPYAKGTAESLFRSQAEARGLLPCSVCQEIAPRAPTVEDLWWEDVLALAAPMRNKFDGEDIVRVRQEARAAGETWPRVQRHVGRPIPPPPRTRGGRVPRIGVPRIGVQRIRVETIPVGQIRVPGIP